MSLTADRNTPEMTGSLRQYGAAAALIHAGALVMLNASGFATKGQAALNLFGIGRAERQVDNSAGSAGDLNVDVKAGVFAWANSSSTDEITAADIGNVCYAVDDQTVAKTSGSGTRSPAGKIDGLDSLGNVLVKMGPEVLTEFRKSRKRAVPMVLTTIAASGTPAYRCISPVSGLIPQIQSIIEGAIGTGDATITFYINGVAITGGVITVTQSGSAAGDKHSCAPSAANYVNAGDEIKAVIGGSATNAVRANVLVSVDAD